MNTDKTFKKISPQSKSKGFTILETLVAILILTLAITGPLVFSQRSLRLANLAKDRITASFLAQDAIETIKNMRDNNLMSGADRGQWLNGLGACYFAVGCKLDHVSIQTPQVCIGGDCGTLNVNNTTYEYAYTSGAGWDSTTFVRTITITDIVPNEEAEITVTVDWQSGVLSSSLTAKEHIFNWIPK